MAVANTKSTSVTNADATQPGVQSKSYIQGGIPVVSVGTVEVAASDDNNSVYRMVKISSSARVNQISFVSDAIAGATDYNMGLHKPAVLGGAVVTDNLFADALNLTTGNTIPLDVTFGRVNIADIEKRVWELLGLTADPFIEYDLTLTGIVVGTAAGTISVCVETVL